MVQKLSSLHTRKKRTKTKDPCPVCDKELYYNKKYTQRIGIFDMNIKAYPVIGWACPHCESEFDINGDVMYIYGSDFKQGKA